MKKINYLLIAIIIGLSVALGFTMFNNCSSKNDDAVLKYYYLKDGKLNITLNDKKLNFKKEIIDYEESFYLNETKIENMVGDYVIFTKDFFMVPLTGGQFGISYSFYDLNGNRLKINYNNSNIKHIEAYKGIGVAKDGNIFTDIVDYSYIEGTFTEYEEDYYTVKILLKDNEIVFENIIYVNNN